MVTEPDQVGRAPWWRRELVAAALTGAVGLGVATLALAAPDHDGRQARAALDAPTIGSTPRPAATPTPTLTLTPSGGAPAPARSRLLPGMPPIAAPGNIYADAGANMLSPALRHVPYRLYVPNSGGSSVDVVNPKTMTLVRSFGVGFNPQHVVPSYDMKTLYVTNDLSNSLTPIDPMTGMRKGSDIPVDDPYNMYFTPNGRYAIVVAEARHHLDFRDPHTFALRHRVAVDCSGVDHMDFSADGTRLLASCEFSGEMVEVDVRTLKVLRYVRLAGSSPQDVKLDPTGTVFYVADRYRGGVWLLDAKTLKVRRFLHTGQDAHGLYPSRDARFLYVTNRRSASVSVVSFAKHRVVTTWHIPGGATPDMGNTSPDGKVLFLAGRYSSAIYALSTTNGHLLGKVAVGLQPHGLCVWPQPGRYSLGHTGVTR